MYKNERVVVSLTSFPKRIDELHQVIESILNQTVSPDEIILNLTNEEFPDKRIPESLSALCGDVFHVEFRELNLRPHNKYFFAMQEHADDIVVTVDDDILYPEDMLEKLLAGYERHPGTVVCCRAHTIKMDSDRNYRSYMTWFAERHIVDKPTHAVLATGVGGVLYPPHILPKETFDLEGIKLVIGQDDLWLKWMEIKNDVKITLVQDVCELKYVEDSQEIGLYINNTDAEECVNDIKWSLLVENYPELDKKVRRLVFEDYSAELLDWHDADMQRIHELELGVSGILAKLEKKDRQLKQLKSSRSYRMGRKLSYIPRKLFGDK